MDEDLPEVEGPIAVAVTAARPVTDARVVVVAYDDAVALRLFVLRALHRTTETISNAKPLANSVSASWALHPMRG